MLRKLSLGLLCIAASFSTTTYAVEPMTMQTQSITMDYDLPPQQAQPFTNYMFWTVTANCVITTSEPSAPLYVLAKAKKGKVNDTPLSAGESITISVKNGDTIRLSADSGAKVEITNYGTQLVKASCTTA